MLIKGLNKHSKENEIQKDTEINTEIDTEFNDLDLDEIDEIDLDDEVNLEQNIKQESLEENTKENVEESITENTGVTFDNIRNKITKKDKIDKFSKTEKGTSLFILTDRYSDRVLEYYRDKGLKVSKMETKLQNIKKEILLAQMLQSTDGCRLVIVETGLGKFTGISARKELVELLGIVNDFVHISVFYTESLIKSDTELKYEEAYSRIDWNNYISTAATVARLLQFGEEYNYTNSIQQVAKHTNDELNEKSIDISKILNSAYNKTDKKEGLNIPRIQDRPILNLAHIQEGLQSDNYQALRSFKEKY